MITGLKLVNVISRRTFDLLNIFAVVLNHLCFKSNVKFLFVASLFCPVFAFAANISKIEIVGNRKIETDAIQVKLTSKAGQEFDEETVSEDIKILFKTGFFSNIEVEKQGDGAGGIILRYRMSEKPSITEIVYEGQSEVKQEDLAEVIGIKQYEILNLAKVKESVEKMQKLYEDKGYFLAKIRTEVQDVKAGESVKLIYKIEENDKVKVKKITFLGNVKIPESELKSKIRTKEEGYFSGMSNSGQYKQEMFDVDVQILRYTYYNLGYVKAKIDRPQVYVSPDKRSIYITIQIEEGEQYSVGSVDFAGDILFPMDEMFETIKIHKNGIFALNVMQEDQSALQAKYGDLGYAYTNVIPKTRFRDEERKVDLTFELDKGNKVYFGKINVVGNTKTRDKVVRRELKVFEGELYNETRRRKSLENIQRLGFFEEVNFKSSTPNDQLDIMNIDIVIKERNTGQINVGAGYGSSQGFTMQGSVKQTNFLGRGQDLGVSLSISGNYQVYDLSFTEPYFNDTEWSVGFRFFQSNSLGSMDYDEARMGASVFTGHPVGEDTRFNLSYSYTDIYLSPIYDNTKHRYITDYELFDLNKAEGQSGSIGASLEYDTRNDRFKPSKGMLARVSGSRTGFGGNLEYYRLGFDARYFKNLFWDVVFRNSFSYSMVDSTNPSKETPFYELGLLGGPYSLRGYRYRRVGRMAFSNQLYNQFILDGEKATDAREKAMRFYGGKQQLTYQGELQFPLIKEAEMYGVAFYDVGQAENQITDSRFFSDVGFGVRWFSPIGPLRFEWGFPLNRDPVYHESVVFEFSIGTPF